MVKRGPVFLKKLDVFPIPYADRRIFKARKNGRNPTLERDAIRKNGIML